MEKNVPVLRFPGFPLKWEVEPIGGKLNLITGIALKTEDISEDSSGIPILRGINITEGFVRHSEDIDRFYLGDWSKMEKFKVTEGDLVLGMDGSKVGRNVALVTKSDANSLLIQRVARLRSNGQADVRFIFQQIYSNRFHKYVDVVNTSSGIPHISAKQIQDFIIGLPSLPEQQKIASFLTAVDDKIQQLSKKKSLLEQYKKGVIQQIFSQKIRFKDDQGNEYPDWEEKVISEICDVKGGKRLPKGYSLLPNHNGYPYITVSDMENGSVSLDKIRYVPFEVVKTIKNYRITTNDIYISVAGTLGLVGIIPEALNQANLTENANKLTNLRCNQRFLYHYLNSQHFQQLVNSVKTSNAQPKLAIYAINSFVFPDPCLDEQNKIASFLSAIDDKINHVTKQIAHTRQYKKGLLQQMFV